MITKLTRLRYYPKTAKNGWDFCICLFRDDNGTLYKYLGKDIPTFSGGLAEIKPEDKGETWDKIPVKNISKIQRPSFAIPNWVTDVRLYKKYSGI